MKGKGNTEPITPADGEYLLYFIISHADKLVVSYEARRGPVAGKDEDATKFDRYGFFYIIQLIPEVLPNRVKLGD